VAFVQSRPMGAFSKNIGFGYGGSGTYVFRLDDTGAFSLRADAGFLGYGYESFRAPLSPTIGGRIEVKVSTTNYLVPLSIGPQIAWPRGMFRPYANAGFATQIFFTESGVEGTSDGGDFASTTNQSDWTAAWVLGGGVYMPVYDRKTFVAIDIGVQYKGYFTDAAVTVPVGKVDETSQRLLQVTEEALAAGIAAATVDNHIGDIGAAVQGVVERAGFSVVRELVGHGVGALPHEEPQVPNYGKPKRDLKLAPGLTIAIEPMVNVGSPRTRTMPDNWTIVTADGSRSAHFEHTVAITEKGPRVLTRV